MAKRKPIATPALLPGDPLGAAAMLLPVLDSEAAAGHEPSLQAAALIRTLLSRRAAVRPASEALSDTVQRLTVLVREQDGQIARLHALLDALL